MANKIDSLTNQYLQISGRSAQTKGPDRSAEQSADAKTASTQTTDTVRVTDDARLLQAVEDRLGQVSEVDSKRVEDIRSRIESGNYSVSAERVADKMIAMDRSLPEGE